MNNTQGGKSRPPPLRGNEPLRNVKKPGPAIKLDMDELLPKKMNVNNTKPIMNIGSSIPKLSDQTDRLGIKLKNFESPTRGPQSLLKGKRTSRNKLNTPSADVLTKYGTKKTDGPVGRKASLENRQSIHTKFQPKAKLMHSFLMGDKETVSEEMTKLHKLVESNVDTTLGFGYSDSDQRREASLRNVSKQSNNPITIVNPDSESTFRAINAKIDSQVADWMRNTPRLKESVRTIKKRPTNSQLLMKTSSTETAGTPIVHEKLKEISDQFHKSLSNATRGIKNLIQTPGDEYIHELSQKTHNALAKISIKEQDIDDIILSAINRQTSARENRVKKSNSLPREFMPLNNDPETRTKLQHYVERRKESFAPRPPRKDFNKDYKNPTVLFDGVDEILPAQMMRRTSLLEASEPQVFQRKVDKGQLDNHRRIVDPGYPHAHHIMQRNSAMLSQNVPTEGAIGWSPRGPLKQRGPPKINDHVGSQGERIRDAQNNHRPNSRRSNISSNLIDTKIGNSTKNIGDAAKVANALGSLMSKISLSNEPSETNMELTGPLEPTPFGFLRKLETPEKRKNDIIDLALELRKMADSSENIYKTALGKMSHKFSTIDQMNKKQGTGLPKSYKNNLPLIPDVSYTDQILLKKLKSMQDGTN